MPGIGVRTGAASSSDRRRPAFPTAAHLASYAGLVSRHPPVRNLHQRRNPARRGNRRLKRAMFLSAFAALHDPTSRAYYDRKISRGQTPQPGPTLPRPAPLRRALRHAPRRRLLQVPASAVRCLTKPGARPARLNPGPSAIPPTCDNVTSPTQDTPSGSSQFARIGHTAGSSARPITAPYIAPLPASIQHIPTGSSRRTSTQPRSTAPTPPQQHPGQRPDAPFSSVALHALRQGSPRGQEPFS